MLPLPLDACSDESSAAKEGAGTVDVSANGAATAAGPVVGFAGDTPGAFVGEAIVATACSASNAVVGIWGFGLSFAGAGALAAPPDVVTDGANVGRTSFARVGDGIERSPGATRGSFFSAGVAGFWREPPTLPVAFEAGCHGYSWELFG